MARSRGITLAEMLLTVLVLGLAVALLAYALMRPRWDNTRVSCRARLNQISKGMATYLNEYGDNRFYPCPLGRGLEPNDYSGAEWLASLYWTTCIPDPGIFLCPSALDWSDDQESDLGRHHAVTGRFGPQTVSYAGMHYHSMTDASGRPIPAPIRDDFPPNEVMACDDTEGQVNHGPRYSNPGMNVLFFDSHAEFWPQGGPPSWDYVAQAFPGWTTDIEQSVGQKGGPLWRLRN